MDWIHCNNCYYTKTFGEERSLYCGSCCHIICKNCLQTKCPLCYKPFNYSQIKDNIIPKGQNVVHSYFEDLNVGRQNLQKRAKFQWEQRTKLEIHQLKILDDIQKTKNEIIELQKMEKLLGDKIREDLIEIQKYKIFIEKVRRSKANISERRSINRNSRDDSRTSFSSTHSEQQRHQSNFRNKDDSGFSGFNTSW